MSAAGCIEPLKKSGEICGKPTRGNSRCGLHNDKGRSARAKKHWASKRCPTCGRGAQRPWWKKSV